MMRGPRAGGRFVPGYGAAPAVLVAALLLAGCGQSDKEKFASDVNDICKDVERSLGRLEGASTPAELGSRGRTLLPEVNRAAARLATVKAPKDVRDDVGSDYTAFVTTFQRRVATFGALVRAADGDNPRVAQTLAGQLAGLEARGTAQAEKLGFDDCKGS